MEKEEIQKTASSFNRADHMANERTFLSWIRTSLGIMAFGFVVEKFAFFIKQLTFFLDKSGTPQRLSEHPVIQGYSSIFGIALVALGALMSLFAYIKFWGMEKQIVDNTYRPSILLDTFLALLVIFIGIFLVVYLIFSV